MGLAAMAAFVGELEPRVGRALAQEGSFGRNLVQRFDDVTKKNTEQRTVQVEKAEDMCAQIHERPDQQRAQGKEELDKLREVAKMVILELDKKIAEMPDQSIKEHEQAKGSCARSHMKFMHRQQKHLAGIPNRRRIKHR